jgi:hypothetical protein
MLLNPNKSKDHEIKIKGIDSIKVGDYSQKSNKENSTLLAFLARDRPRVIAEV